MTLAYNNKSTSGHGTDGQTDGQSATQYAAPSYGGAPHNNYYHYYYFCFCFIVYFLENTPSYA